MVADFMFHDFVAGPAPHDLLDYHQPHGERKIERVAIKEEMRGNVKGISDHTA